MAAKCWPILVSAVLGFGPMGAAQTPLPEANLPPMAGASEPRFYFDCPHPWLHGYIQEAPAYSGFHSFRPYNYKHVFTQSQMAGSWGIAPTSPYSQQYWNRERPAQANVELPQITPSAIVPSGAWQPGSARQ
jgi:hypothetical protein